MLALMVLLFHPFSGPSPQGRRSSDASGSPMSPRSKAVGREEDEEDSSQMCPCTTMHLETWRQGDLGFFGDKRRFRMLCI